MHKTKRVTVRFSPEEYDTIMTKTISAGMTISEFLRDSALDNPIVVRQNLAETMIELRRIGNNLNQLTRLCNEERITCLELRGVKKGVAEVWQLLNSQTVKAD